MEKQRFQVSLFISFFIHLLIVASLSLRAGEFLTKKKVLSVEVTYQIIQDKDESKKNLENIFKEDKKIKKRLAAKEPLAAAELLTVKKTASMPFQGASARESKNDANDFSQIGGALNTHLILDKKERIDNSLRGELREIFVPSLMVEKMSNPKYSGYKEHIRRKIKEKAYSYIQDPELNSGDVYLNFVFSADGYLRQLRIIEDKTRANEYLRHIGLKSIEEADPFPPFPKDLNYPELTFSVPISFRVNK